MDFSRQKELFDPAKFGSTPVHIIGCGATGSWVALQLCKLGVKEFHLYDDDVVEEHNIPNQFFSPKTDISSFKAESLKEEILNYGANDPNVNVTVGKVTGKEPQRMSGIVFCLVDSMKSRKEIFQNGVKLKPGIQLYVETRMGLEMGRVYAINPISIKEIRAYEATLYSDEDASVSACGTSQSIAPTANIIASMAVWKLIKHHNQFDYNNEVLFDIQNLNILTSKWD